MAPHGIMGISRSYFIMLLQQIHSMRRQSEFISRPTSPCNSTSLLWSEEYSDGKTKPLTTYSIFNDVRIPFSWDIWGDRPHLWHAHRHGRSVDCKGEIVSCYFIYLAIVLLGLIDNIWNTEYSLWTLMEVAQHMFSHLLILSFWKVVPQMQVLKRMEQVGY